MEPFFHPNSYNFELEHIKVNQEVKSPNICSDECRNLRKRKTEPSNENGICLTDN